MRNKVIILSLSLVMVLCSSFSVFAFTRIDLVMTEPATSDTQGYLVVTNPDKDIKNVFYWSITPYKASEELNTGTIPSMSLVLNDDSITFTALYNGNARVTLTRVNNSSTQVTCMSRQFTTSTQYEYTGMANIEYYCYGGNIGIVDDNISSTNNYLTVNWGTATDYQNEFDEVVNELVQLDVELLNIYTRLGILNGHVDGLETALGSANTSLDNIESYLNSVKSYVDTVETKLSTLIENVDTVESKLSTIIGYIDGVESKLDTANEHLDQIEDYFVAALTYLESIDTTTESIDFHCEQIEIALKNMIDYMYGEEDTDPLDDSDIGDLGSDEDEVLDDDADLIDDLSLSFGNAFDVVWDLISQAWQSNPKVFTVVIMCLTIGVLKLILNR